MANQCEANPADIVGTNRQKENPPMKISDIIPEAKMLTKLGFRKQKSSILEFFRPPAHPKKPDPPIKPDVDYPNHDERTPQAQNYTQMWLNHWDNWGNVKNPVATPME